MNSLNIEEFMRQLNATAGTLNDLLDDAAMTGLCNERDINTLTLILFSLRSLTADINRCTEGVSG